MTDAGRARLWVAAVVVSALLVLVTQRGPVADATAERPTVLFWTITVGALVCWIPAIVGLRLAVVRGSARAAVVAAMLWCASVLPLVHGLTTPGVVYGEGDVSLVSALLALPFVAGASLPLAFEGSAVGAALLRRWRGWSYGWAAASTGLAGFLLLRPHAIPLPTSTGLIRSAAGAAGGAVTWVSLRHLRVQWVGSRPAPVAVSVGLAMLGASSLVWLDARPWTPGWWIAHALDVVGVVAAAAGVLWGLRLHAAPA